MKALSLWQPWASHVAFGRKLNETRSWWTEYRGDVVICSSKRKPTIAEFGGTKLEDLEMLQIVPFGKALCVVEIYACVKSDHFFGHNPIHQVTDQEKELGDYSPGRFVWMTRNLRRLTYPVPVRGYQKIFELTPDETEAVRSYLPPAI